MAWFLSYLPIDVRIVPIIPLLISVIAVVVVVLLHLLLLVVVVVVVVGSGQAVSYIIVVLSVVFHFWQRKLFLFWAFIVHHLA